MNVVESKLNTRGTANSLVKRAAQVQRGSARAAVLGVNDGLVSTLCLVVGVAAAGGSSQAVLTAGLAGLLAGALSMAAGEWISVKAQVELFEGVLSDLKTEMKRNRQQLIADLADNFERHGIDRKTADHAAGDVARKDAQLVSMYSAEVIGINESELGSPWRAAASSFLLFVAGSMVPLLPWILGFNSIIGIVMAISLTCLGGLLVGGYTARSSGKGLTYGAIRQLVIILLAAGVTYGIGSLFGVVTA
ncbi:MAG: hypothetical protein EOO17_02770 [Chloroflexi bacterium]|nr:MAG: hypothetical protein EOO17_02770 [Chloroflexota bacterium]